MPKNGQISNFLKKIKSLEKIEGFSYPSHLCRSPRSEYMIKAISVLFQIQKRNIGPLLQNWTVYKLYYFCCDTVMSSHASENILWYSCVIELRTDSYGTVCATLIHFIDYSARLEFTYLVET